MKYDVIPSNLGNQMQNKDCAGVPPNSEIKHYIDALIVLLRTYPRNKNKEFALC